jgi:glycosyltransferase involved in cell wall biosynthesis
MKTAVFTIASNNYAAYARTLCQSLRLHEPRWDRYVLIVDLPPDSPLISPDEARTLQVQELPYPIKDWFFFQYSILEANTAVKPWMFEWLFEQGYEAVVYFDPDIKVYSPLSELSTKLSEADILLTPHLTQPYDDDAYPNEKDIRRSGIYNLGFAALRNSPAARKAVDWWKDKMKHDSRVALDEGIFVDQSWMDFAPAFFGAQLLMDPGCNIAYWNLHERVIDSTGFPATPPLCKGKPIKFFHFSGFDYRKPFNISIHQNRFHSGNMPLDVHSLLSDYAENLRQNGIESTEIIPYGLGSLDGLQIPDFLRRKLLGLATIQAAIRSNSQVQGLSRQVLDYFCSPDPESPCLPVFLGCLYRLRPDLQAAFVGCDCGFSIPHLVEWFDTFGRREYPFDARFPSNGWWSLETNKQRMARALAKRLADWGMALHLFLAKAISNLRSLDFQRLSNPETDDNGLRVNLYGYFLANTGMGEAARSMTRALTHLGVSHRVIDFDHKGAKGNYDLPFALPDPTAHVDLAVINADSFEYFIHQNPELNFPRRYRVGLWFWEMDQPPEKFSQASGLVDEIWCASELTASVFRRHTQQPIRVAGLNLSKEWDLPHAFPFSDIPCENRFLYLTLCDCLSHPERKNPVKALQAYLQAFPTPEQDTLMLVKVTNGYYQPETLQKLSEMAAQRPDVFIRDVQLSRNQVIGLIQHTNVLISLHAHEGFGLPIAEAISLGKEVVVTAYGGNMDFCNSENAWLVPFQTIALGKNIGPYKKGNTWAEPNLAVATDFLREIYLRWKKGLLNRPSTTLINDASYRMMAKNLNALRHLLRISH